MKKNFVLYQPVLRSDRRRGYGVCAEPSALWGMHGSANTFGAPLKDIAEIVATIVCGDNFYAENMETGRAFLLEQIKKYQTPTHHCRSCL